MHKRFRTRGFTIVELLIVISVIGILAGIAVVGYAGYQKNAQNSKIGATISAYQLALEGITFEDDAKPELGACLGKDSTGPCCIPYMSASRWACGNNYNAGDYRTIAAYASVKRYVPNDIPELPKLKSALDTCPGSLDMNRSGPCDTKQDITYYDSFPTSSGTTPGFVYYLPPDYDCNSSNTMRFDSATFTWSKQEGTKFSRRVTAGPKPYTECVVSLK